VSGRKGPAMRRAARRGDGWMPYLVSAGAYARSVGTIRAEAEAAGRDLAGFEWLLYLYCSIRPDADRAREDVAGFLGRAYGDKPAAMLDRIAPSGTPEEVAGKVQAYVDAGARHIVISPAARQDTLEVVRLAAEEVLPRLEVRA
jgi:alkanesulfonate monooxygenase SsuD/methylene tetrahydromethanopterin reductase-like flavin-dependent oxidoreductase (luciferase family)